VGVRNFVVAAKDVRTPVYVVACVPVCRHNFDDTSAMTGSQSVGGDALKICRRGVLTSSGSLDVSERRRLSVLAGNSGGDRSLWHRATGRLKWVLETPIKARCVGIFAKIR
jgi:hypothetical protein